MRKRTKQPLVWELLLSEMEKNSVAFHSFFVGFVTF